MKERLNGIGAVVLPALAALFLAGFGRCEPAQWTLVWQDEFDGAAGQPPDPASWTFDLGTGVGGWGNGESQYYRAENATLDGAGHLAITAKKEAFLGSQYTSARIITKGKLEQKHGRFEARIKLPKGQGIWPAFWLLGANIDTVTWPGCGEIDVMESRGQEPSVVLGSLHGPGYSGAGAVTDSYTLPGPQGEGADFHVFAVNWDPGYIAWEVDGVTYQVATPKTLPTDTQWVFDNPFFIILNVAVGGNFLGYPDESTVFPQTMLVDYVRVYEAD